MRNLRQTTRRQLEQFLSALFLPEELIEVRFIESWQSLGKKLSRVVQPAEWVRRTELASMHRDLIATAQRTRANIYFGVCPREKAGDADDQSIETVRCVWCDIDDVALDEAYDRWNAAGVPRPSIVVSSGYGIHGYWLLEHDLKSPERRSQLARMLPRFYQGFGGDHVQNLSRVMRLPGTANLKDARNGKPPRSCSLCCCDPDIRYPFQAFSQWIDRADEERPSRSPSEPQLPAGRLPADQIRSRPEVQELVQRLDMPATDRSRRDFAVVCELLRLGVDREAIWRLVSGSSKFDSHGRPYFDITITNAERSILVVGHHAEHLKQRV